MRNILSLFLIFTMISSTAHASATRVITADSFADPLGTKSLTFSGSASIAGSNSGDVTIGTANGLSLSGQALSLGLSSTSTTGALSDTDWDIFNGKLSDVVGDVSPQLGGDLDVNSFSIYLGTAGRIAENLSQANLSFPSSSSVKIEQATAGNSVLVDSDSVDLDAGAGTIEVLSNIDMQTTKKVTNLADGTVSGDAVNKGQLDTKLDSSAFTDSAVTSKVITGFTSGAGTVAATDTILEAIEKLDGNIAAASASSFVVGDKSSPQTYAASATFTSGTDFSATNYHNVIFLASTGGAVSGNDSVDCPLAGQRLMLVGTSDTNTIEFADSANMSFNGNVILGLNDSVELICDDTAGVWVETGRSN